MHPDRKTAGHLAALLTILIWGTTFISTKVLLTQFQPVEILFFRFLLGLAALLLVYPHRLRNTTWRQELTFAAAGLSGVCLYYLLENIALTYTLAANVSVMVALSPFFTALFTHLFLKDEDRLRVNFLLGFVLAITGICLISFSGARLALNPLGDLLAVAAAIVWACYAVLTRKIGGYGYHTILVTRRIFCYGLLFMLPALLLFDFRLDHLTRLADPVCLANLLFLGLGASALCFVTWNFAVRQLGAVRTSVYIYMVPVITLITSVLILQEPVTPLSCLGMLLTLAGLGLSERTGLRRSAAENSK
ncbi:MAG: DMT family transporter [Clostridiales bacterium]|nr:DMT family transporter [Clostridiales bacterium]